MAQAMTQPKFNNSTKFQKFSKYDFIKSYTANAKNDEVKKEKEQEAAIIADAIEKTQTILLENLATKADINALEVSTKADINALEVSTKADIKALEVSTKAEIKALEMSTKADIKALEVATKADIKALEVAIKADIKVLEKDIKILEIVIKKDIQNSFIKLGSAIIVIFGALPLLVSYLKHLFGLQ